MCVCVYTYLHVHTLTKAAQGRKGLFWFTVLRSSPSKQGSEGKKLRLEAAGHAASATRKTRGMNECVLILLPLWADAAQDPSPGSGAPSFGVSIVTSMNLTQIIWS